MASSTTDHLTKTKHQVSTMLKQGFISDHFLSPPPPDPPTRPTTTLFEMMSSEEPTPQKDPFDPSRARAEERVKRVLSRAPFMIPGCGDVKLTCTARDGFSVSVNVDRDVLVSKSRFFEEKLVGGVVRKSWCVEICECDDVEVYLECLVLMYCQDGEDFRNKTVGEGVDKILGLLKVCDALKFDDGISSCLKYLEAVPWSEGEEERVIMNLNELHLPNDHEVFERVALEASTSSRIDDIFLRLFTGVLQAKDEKARREMKSLISRLLREDNSMPGYNDPYNKLEISKETLYTICHKCVTSLILCLSEATSGDEENRGMMSEIAREADNLEWVVDILIEKRICEDFVKLWADQNELAMLHLRVPVMYRHKISRITAQLCIAIGRGNALVPKETRVALLSTWLEALYDDFGWMKRGEKQQNGTYNISVNFGARSEAHSSTSDSRNKSDLSTRISLIPSKSSDMHDTRSESSNDVKGKKKFSVTRISKAKSINVDFRLSRGIAQVNEGQYARAISIFDQVLREDPTYPEALIGRGTAYAFKRELDSAIADFTKALQSNPSAGEAWKRRGQARAALGESVEAIADLTKSLEFEPDSADILHERGIVNFKIKDFKAATEDLSECVKLDKDNKSAYTYLGLALSSLGEYKKAEEAHLKAIQIDQNFLDAWGHLAQFYQDLASSEKALDCLEKALKIDARFAKGYHLRGLLLHAMGDHRKAIKDLSVGLSIESSNIECLYLRASCHHAVGEYKEAVKDYDAALDLELDSMDKFVLQCLAFYQKEIALYTSAKINSEFSWFDIDRDVDPMFKEYWCKRLHPKNVCEKVYRQPPLRKAKVKKQDFTMTKPKSTLLSAADRVGKTIQYHCPGFLPNKRQHRMAGLAAIEIAQRVSKVWRSLQSEWRFSTKVASKNGKRPRRKEKIIIPRIDRDRTGCSSEASTSSALEEKSPGQSVFSWLHLYSVAVKWRQISEPCDPVVWVNKLSEEFNSGFGSNTPLILGQARITRYYPHLQRTLDVAKTLMKENGCVYSKADCAIDLTKDGKLEEILKAESCSDLYKVIGEDFWLATWCNSTAFEGKRLEGTRITLVKTGECGFDFAIRTPCTPARWDEFDAEMASAWEVLCNSYCGETYGSNDFGTLENVREAILRMTYYWYNFMPLSRGSAVVGFSVMLGLLLAANMEFTGSIPEGRQVDWDAILSLDPDSFMDSVKSWLYPSLKVTTAWKDIPDVASTLETTGSVVAALSSYSS